VLASSAQGCVLRHDRIRRRLDKLLQRQPLVAAAAAAAVLVADVVAVAADWQCARLHVVAVVVVVVVVVAVVLCNMTQQAATLARWLIFGQQDNIYSNVTIS